MNMTITGRKVTLKDSFKQRCEKKLAKIGKFFDDDAHANVTVTVEKSRQTVEITVKSKGMLFRAEQTAPDMLDSLEEACDAIVRQIRKNKTRLEKRGHSAMPEDYDFGDAQIEEEAEFNVVRTKKFPMKELEIDEAILQMNMLGHQFYMFKNGTTGDINVVYKRNQGDYGLIEPEK